MATASSARQARTEVMEFRPALIVLDVGLPDEDGFALAQRLISEVRAQKRQRTGQDGGPVAGELG